MHGNDRYRYPSDHPFRTGRLRRFLMNYNIWQPKPNNAPSPLMDACEDFVHLTAASVILGWAVSSIPYFNVNSVNLSHANVVPYWASKILTQVKFVRSTAVIFTGLSLYYGMYNFLTGVQGWPVTKYGEFHCAASCVALLPAALFRAYLRPVPQNRARSPVFSRFGIFYTGWAIACGVVALYNYQLSVGWDDGNVPHNTMKEKYYEQLRNAPGYDIVAKMPYVPFYKETPQLPFTCTRNPFHDAEFVKAARADVAKTLANYQL